MSGLDKYLEEMFELLEEFKWVDSRIRKFLSRIEIKTILEWKRENYLNIKVEMW